MELARTRDRNPRTVRDLHFERDVVEHAAGSVLVTAGRTKVLCTVAVTDGVPKWMAGQNQAWLTAEYSMLPASTRYRKMRDGRSGGRIDARSLEIQRLIGRALRAAVDVRALPEITLWVDCDVVNADGGTRTAAINGACVALFDALEFLREAGRTRKPPFIDVVGAVSVGLVKGEILVDLDYHEDSRADLDLNVVRLGDQRLVEIQGAAEGRAFEDTELLQMLEVSKMACAEVHARQREALGIPDPVSAPEGDS